MEKLKQWMEMAQKYQSGNFWDVIFDQDSNTDEQNNQTYRRESQANPPLNRFPLTDIYLTDTQVIVIIELPGFQKEDVQVSLSGNKLLIKGVSKIPIMTGTPFLNERKYGEFERLIELPEPTERKDIQAKFENGLLFVTYTRRYTQHEHIPIL